MTERAPSAVVDLSGIWGFPLTPFDECDRIDLDLLAAGAEFQLGSVDVLCACGAIAQGELLTAEERTASLRAVLDAADGRVQVVLALLADAGAPAAALAAAEGGVDALLLLPTDRHVEGFAAQLRSIAAAAPRLPLVVYHRPPLSLAPDELRRLAEIEELAGLKVGHRDVRSFRRLRAAVGDRVVWISAWEDVALPFWALGCNAFAPASTAYAQMYARAWLERLEAGDVRGAAFLLDAHAYAMVDLRLSRPNIEVTTVKAAMELCGLRAGRSRPPAEPLTEPERAAVAKLVSDLHLALEREAGAMTYSEVGSPR